VERAALRVIDSHTGGEPTRVVYGGVPSLGGGDMRSRREVLASGADWIRTSLTLEPRGAAWMVGAVLEKPVNPECEAGIIFFNNEGYLGMCGHGLIGVVATLKYLGRITAGRHRFETPVGEVAATLLADGRVEFDNVTSYRLQKDVAIEVPGRGVVKGDVAFGGNWFYLTSEPELNSLSVPELMERAVRVRKALEANGITGADGAVIDHIELVGPPSDSNVANSRNFVLCPGREFDRSPCGTGLSAKLACLAADGVIAPGEPWVMESIVGSRFTGSYRPVERGVVPTVCSQAFVTAETTVVVDPADPYRFGFKSAPDDVSSMPS
jgi:4-hydroxyproline epimerase